MESLPVDAFFAGHPDSRVLFDALRAAAEGLGDFDVRVSKSQVGLARRHIFARAWVPARHLGEGRGAPLVLTIGFRSQDPSPRWKQIVEPSPGRFTHHLELASVGDIDDEVLGWLRRAYSEAG